MPTGAVTVTQGGSTAAGTDAYGLVFTGQKASPIGAQASATNTTPSLAITPTAANSYIVGSNLGALGTWTALANTTFLQNRGAQGLEYVSFRSSAVTPNTSPITCGSSTGTSISIVELEILAAVASLAIDASSPGGFSSSGLSAVSSSFTPPASSLIVLLVQTNGNLVVTTSISDTLGGLTWTEQVKQNTSGNGYCGIWTAPVPAAVASSGMLLAGDI